jgi:hypothetical protein
MSVGSMKCGHQESTARVIYDSCELQEFLMQVASMLEL